jgi:hypothetical protein
VPAGTNATLALGGYQGSRYTTIMKFLGNFQLL